MNWFRQYENAPHEIDARRVEKGINLIVEDEEKAALEVVRADLAKEALTKQWRSKLATARDELMKAMKDKAPDNVVQMRNADVIEAQGIVDGLSQRAGVFP
jgi:hypothetical protein